MWSILKTIIYFFAAIFFICIIGPLLIFIFASPEIYKSPLVEMLQKTTGRQVMINGPLHWSFYPAIGVSAENIIIENPQNFEENTSVRPFLFIRSIDTSIELEPLFHQQIKVKKILLDGVEVNLIKNKAGKVNWIFDKPLSVSQSEHKKIISLNNQNLFSQGIKFMGLPANFTLNTMTLSEVQLKNVHLTYEDQPQKKKFQIEQLKLNSEQAAMNTPFPVQASFLLTMPRFSQPVNVTIKANMTLHADKIILDDLHAATNQYQWQGKLESFLNKKDLTALSGHLSVSGKQGAFKGIDLYYYKDLADAFIHKTAVTRKDTHQTLFNTLNASMELDSGIMHNQDLYITAEGIEARGKGEVNLITQQINYHLTLQRMTHDHDIKPRGPGLPIVLTGNLLKPTIRPDWQAILISEVKAQIASRQDDLIQKVDQAIQKGLQKLWGT